MIKYMILFVELLLLSSCDYNMESGNESNVSKRMRDYISNNVDGSYGFFECNVVKEHIDSLCWKADIYRIQQQIYMYASQRRFVIVNSYVPVQIAGWLPHGGFDLDFVEPQGYGKQIHKSYITKEEREVCDYVCYNNSVPAVRKIVKELEAESFHGDRIYYACGYRIASGAIVYRQYVLYKRDDLDKRDDWDSFTICELTYNYDMLRNFVQSTLDINLEDSKIKAFMAKYKSKEDKDDLNSIWGGSTSTVSDKYNAVFRRLKNY